MDGVWRGLRDVGKTVSGVLGVRSGEGEDRPRPPARSDVPGAPEGPAAQAGTPEGGAAEPVRDDAGQGDAGPAEAAQGEVVEVELVEVELVEVAVVDVAGVDLAGVEVAPEPVPAPAEPDPVLAAAVEPAREAAVELGGASVGEHLGVEVDGPEDAGPVLTHSFATTDPAYRGWRWAVTVARALDSEHVTVDEVVLLPGAGALLAPAWVPWSERLAPGDLSAGDLLPPPADDPRLVPAYAEPEAELADETRWELGLGRPRVLSVEGRADAAERWYEGLAGPDAPAAKQAPGRCDDCGFLVLLAGGLRSAFGVCANAYAPDDGRVVALSHGCGAHSETVVDGAHAATAGMAVEDDEFELLPVGPPAGEDS